MMQLENSNFYSSAKKLWETVVSVNTPGNNELQLQIELHKRLLNIFQPGNYYYLLFNIYKGEIEHISQGIVEVLGYLPEEMNMHVFMENIHAEDKSYFIFFEDKITSFFKTVPTDKIKNYKVQYDLRLKNKNNKYTRVLIQYVLVDYDDNNLYQSFHVHTDISHIKQTGSPSFSIIGLDGEPSYYNIKKEDALVQSYDLFTKREKEVLKLIVEGYSSKKIAEKLFISLYTVNTHRKNILGKTICKTPMELASRAINEGWV